MRFLPRRSVRGTALGFLLLVASGNALSAQAPAAPAPGLTPAQVEDFLLHARITSSKSIGRGVTNARRITLNDGTFAHDAQLQTVDEAHLVFQTPRGAEFNFKDSYRYNIAAYRIARLIGLDNVPVSVERNVGGKTGALTWWIDDVMIEEGDRLKKRIMAPDQSRFAMQIHLMRVFDELIQNTDRNAGNILWTKDWKLWLIDHTRAFRLGKELRAPQLLERCDRNLFASLHDLTADAVHEAVGDSLLPEEINALMTRRDALVEHFTAMIAATSEPAVLYTLPR